MQEIAKALKSIFKEQNIKALLDIARDCEPSVTAYIIKYVVLSNTEIVSNEKNMLVFCQMLGKEGMSEFSGVVLDCYIEKLNSYSEFEQFIRAVNNYDFISEKKIVDEYLAIDEKMGIHLKGTKVLAELLQSTKPNDKVKLINSAHILAYNAISKYRHKDESLKQILSPYVK